MPKKTPAPATPETTTHTYKLLLFTKERCAPCAVAKPQVEKAAKTLGMELEIFDAVARETGRLIIGLNILAVPTLVIAKDGHKWLEFSVATELTEKHIVEKTLKQIAKESK